MEYKLVVLDLDDTLLNEDHVITDRTIATINKIKNRSIKIVIATGRMLASAVNFVRELKLSTPVITYNGAYIKDINDDQVLYHKPISITMAKKIINDGEEHDLHINLYQDDRLFVAEENESGRSYAEVNGIELNCVGPLNQFISKPPTKLLMIEKNRERQQFYLNYFKEKYEPAIEVTESKRAFIEFGAKGVSKGNALEIMADRFGIDRKEVIAIGDGWNDLEMIKTAGLGIAMKNAPAGVKDQADIVAPHHNEEGAASVLEDVLEL